MAAVELATGYVSLAASTRGLGRDVARQFGTIERQAGTSSRKIGRSLDRGLNDAGKSGGKKFGGGILSGANAVKAGVAGIIGGAIVGGITRGLGSVLKAGGDIEQSMGGVRAVFKKTSISILEDSAAAADAVGLSRNAFNELATTLGATLKNKGVKDYTKATQDLIGLGADLAATFGGTSVEAVEALSSMLRGESDPIERYGISINETAVNLELAARGQDKLKGAALDQAKTQARLRIAFRQSKDAQGAFSRESDTLAGKQQRAAAKWENLKATIGVAFLPTASNIVGYISDKAIPALSDFFSKLSEDKQLRTAISNLKSALEDLTGKDVDFAGILDSIATSLPPVVQGLSDIVTKYGEISAAIDKFEQASFGEGDKVGGPLGRFIKDFGPGGTIDQAIGRFRDWLPKQFSDMWGRVAASFASDTQFVGGFFRIFGSGGTIEQALVRFRIWVPKQFSDMWSSVRDGVSGFAIGLDTQFSKLYYGIVGWVSRMWGEIKSWFSDNYSFITAGVSRWVGQVGAWFANLKARAVAWVNRMWADARASFTKNFGFIGVAVGRWVGQIGTWFGNLKARVVAWVIRMWGEARTSFVRNHAQIITGVGRWVGQIGTWFGNLKARVVAWVIRMWGEARTSFVRNHAQIGADVQRFVGRVIGIFVGWKNRAVQIVREMSAAIRGAVTHMMNAVRQGFAHGVGLAGQAWSKIKSVIATPVAFVVNTILEKGILKAFRDISNFVGYAPGKNVHVGWNLQPTRQGGTAAGLASGGILPGYTPGRDVHHFTSATGGTLELSGGEGIARPEIVKAVGKKRWIAAQAAAARGHVQDALEYLGPQLGHYASGGIVAAEQLARSMGIRSIGTYPGHHPSQALARDFMTSNKSVGDRFAEALWQNRRQLHLWYEIWYRRIRSMTRESAGWRAYTRSNPHTDHVHGSFYPAALSGVVGALSKVSGVVSSGIDIGKYIGMVNTALGKLSSIEKTPFGKMIGGLPRKVAGAVKDKISELGAKAVNVVGSGFISAGGGSNRAIGKRMMLQRWPASEWPSLDWLWTKESNWRTRATNPSSGAYGIPQSLPGSKMASAGSDWRTNPATQIKWGLGYIGGRHGSPSGAKRFHLAHNWYDDGGILPPGLSLAYNGTSRNEDMAILPHRNRAGGVSTLARPITIILDLGDGVAQRVQGIIDDNDEFKATVGRTR